MRDLVENYSYSLVRTLELLKTHLDSRGRQVKSALLFIYNTLICDEGTIDKIIDLGLLHVI